MDRKETEIRAGERPDRIRSGRTAEVGVAEPSSVRFEDLLKRADELHRAEEHEQAIHVWTRVLFLDRRNPEARKGIDSAKRSLAERQRRVDAEVAEGRRLLDSGDLEGARSQAREALAADARHPEASSLLSEIAAAQRRVETADIARDAGAELATPAPEKPVVTTENARAESVAHSKGFVLRVPRSRSRARVGGGSSLQIAFFIASVAFVFAASGYLLYSNWERLVGDGALGGPDSLVPALSANPDAAEVPSLAELHYYNGARLFAKGRYREALAELSRVGRDAEVAEDARSLILRIEERLLRGASEPDPLELDETPRDPARQEQGAEP